MDWRKVLVECCDQDGTAVELVVGEESGSVVIWRDEDQALWIEPEQAVALAKALMGYAAIAATPTPTKETDQ